MSSPKSKIRFTRYKNVPKKEALYLKSLAKEGIRENKELAKILDENYHEIVVYFFKTGKEEKQNEVMGKFFERDIKGFDRASSPANASSDKNKGFIVVNTDNLKKFSDRRDDYVNLRDYHKLVMFEEFCHLAEHKGSSFNFPKEVDQLFVLYSKYAKKLGKGQDVGYEIIKNLRNNRNHYEVYRMMADCYPELFFKRWSMVFWEEGDYATKYELWRNTLNQNIALARLISDYILRKVLFIIIGEYDAYGIKKGLISTTLEKCENALKELHSILEKEKPEIIELLKNIDDSVLAENEVFWAFILELWKKNGLLE